MGRKGWFLRDKLGVRVEEEFEIIGLVGTYYFNENDEIEKITPFTSTYPKIRLWLLTNKYKIKRSF